MDKQTNILSNTQNLIPVNTRTIGAPEGIYILYLEDYVHTFIKKILSVEDEKPHPDIALYGRSVEESGRRKKTKVRILPGSMRDAFISAQVLKKL